MKIYFSIRIAYIRAKLAATAAALPPELPPALFEESRGFNVGPKMLLSQRELKNQTLHKKQI